MRVSLFFTLILVVVTVFSFAYNLINLCHIYVASELVT